MPHDVEVKTGDAAQAASPDSSSPDPHDVRRSARRASGPRSAWRQRLSRWDVRFSPYVYISPFFILFLIVGMFPLVYTAVVSVYDWSLIGGKGRSEERRVGKEC